ncbi:MAG: adenylate kinase family protein, partial [archaeon]
MKIIISGTPGTGKTEVSKLLAKKLNYRLIDINTFAKKNHLITGTDTDRNSQIIDENKLRKKSISIEDNTIMEGHLAHYCTADIAIILRTNPEILRERLKKRQWSKKKIDENIEAETLDIILQESVS